MNFLNSFKQNLFSLKPEAFEQNALTLFAYQAKNNIVYRTYVKSLGIDSEAVTRLGEIPFLPIDFYKNHELKTGEWVPEAVFQSSGTTGQQRSKHFMQDVAFYGDVARTIFESSYGDLKQYHIQALLPSYLERNNASLVFMVDDFIKKTGSPYSGFFLQNTKELVKQLRELLTKGERVLLIGVTYALLELLEQFEFDFDASNLIVMETGGMKGRRKEMIREELQTILSGGFNTDTIHSEYGMTELTSQAYSKGYGKFTSPPWMKILIREINDPFELLPREKIGGVNIIDFANAASCSFIETKDLGKINADGSFSILGRFDNTELRGCNLMIG